YVVMPEHVHLLISEPRRGTPSTVMQVLKQTVARRLLLKPTQPLLWEPLQHFWQKRFYDFNVWSAHKWTEKLKYMHENPVRRGLAPSPELWEWSSYRAYAYGQPGVVKLNGWPKPEFVAGADPESKVPGTHPAKTAQGGPPTLG
ncbi:MAG TPA: transposase, partial [Terriglobales bacterium]|nr:transposase [Terriglobales bacterium]